MTVLYCLFLFLILEMTLVRCSWNGAPTRTCVNMTPSHGNSTFQTSQSPYYISVKGGNNIYTVTINGSSSFKGFIVGAFDYLGHQIGLFESLDVNTKYRCNSTAVTHNSTLNVSSVSFSVNLKPNYKSFSTDMQNVGTSLTLSWTLIIGTMGFALLLNELKHLSARYGGF
ncbi:hypothetical protein HELRODRAFT_163509 [Helobdella robusta]|uniref:Reelin domain-containing protein n=1 Tax=Helobdella robusta TaxID=6412 RepID=T1EU55_HELRO|nr:hypothetical protein HELRODRAFT_163509 [Helobdella robusta]ESN96448.1 hypothetical protein HELRODRAFT_163509 [Helobdella robusta]